MTHTRTPRLLEERGVAMVIALLLIMTLSILGASLMFLSQTETVSSISYRLMSQARYGAEAGVNVAANYLVNTYQAPRTDNLTDPIAAFVTTSSPVTWNGQPVVLAANGAAVASNYPVAAVKTAFATAISSLGNLTAGNSSIQYLPYATLMSMSEITPAQSFDGQYHTIQTWQVISDGTINTGARTATVQVAAVIDRQLTASVGTQLSYGAFATSATCGGIKLSGGAATKSYDSSRYSGTGAPTPANGGVASSGGNVGTNGNLTESGGATVNGTLSSPRSGVGSCTAGNVDAETTSGGAAITGGLVKLSQSVSLPAPSLTMPNLGAPPATNISIGGGTMCSSLSAVVPAANCSDGGVAGHITISTLANSALTLGNISVTGGTLTIADVSGATYTLGNVSVSGAGTINMNPTATIDATTIVNMTSFSSSGGGAETMGSGTYNTNSVSISGGTALTIDPAAQVTMNVVNTFTMSGGGKLSIPADSAVTAPATPAQVFLNVPGTTAATPLDFSGGTVANNSYDASRFQIQYGGAGALKLSGGTAQAEAIYAPNASASFSGGAALYGEVIASTVTDSGGAIIYYDRNLANKGLFTSPKYTPGNSMLSSFTWKKY